MITTFRKLSNKVTAVDGKHCQTPGYLSSGFSAFKGSEVTVPSKSPTSTFADDLEVSPWVVVELFPVSGPSHSPEIKGVCGIETQDPKLMRKKGISREDVEIPLIPCSWMLSCAISLEGQISRWYLRWSRLGHDFSQNGHFHGSSPLPFHSVTFSIAGSHSCFRSALAG